ncbi:MAG: hypothetical protein OXG58_02125 [Gemmatimonadetes bacterium]|nr:hypothetical protein [Gemmatimonadota bacterium]MCY3943042.1 hypothetical protein [Gemmatimonadota bacterium]
MLHPRWTVHGLLGHSGASLLEVVVLLAVVAALAPTVVRSAAGIRAAFHLLRAQEDAARILSEARWVAVGTGGAVVEVTADPPGGVLMNTAGDTLRSVDFGEGGVSLGLSRGRASSRLRFGPMALGLVSSQTLTFSLAGAERKLVVSSLGRVSRR